MRDVALRELIHSQTTRIRPPLTPEIEIFGATELTPIWSATEAALDEIGLAPPFWAFAWPGGQALARYLLDDPDRVRGRRVLALAAGAGVEAIAAALSGAALSVANDVDPTARAAARLNAGLNGVAIGVDGSDLRAAPRADAPLTPESADLLLLGDALYEESAAAAFLGRLRAAAARGAEVLIGDPDRGRLPRDGLEALATYEVPVDPEVEDVASRQPTVYRLR